MNTNNDQLAPLRAFGYTEVEARFLCLAAAHSGYFTARQFLRFTGAKSGKRSARFVQKALTLGHASSQRCWRNSLLYHLDSRPLYAAIGKQHLRHRRSHDQAHIKSRLLALDFILSHPEHEYFETSEAKRGFFRDRLGVHTALLESTPDRPARITFADGFPLFLAPQSPGYSPVVTFTFVDSEGRNLTRYLRHLRTYRPLFHALECFQFLYISAKSGLATEAGVLFSLVIDGNGVPDLLRYFDVKRKWETQRMAHLRTEDLIFLNQKERSYSGQTIQSLYTLWKRNQLPNDLAASGQMQSPQRPKMMFRAVAVPTQGGIFGPQRKRWGDGWQKGGLTQRCSPELSPTARIQTQETTAHT